MKQFNNKIEAPNSFLWFQYSKSCTIHGFDINKYKGMKIENQIYVYDKIGLLQGIICGPTDEDAIKEVKKYILRKIFLNLLKGGDDHNFNSLEKAKIRREEWVNLWEFIKSKFQKK